MDVTFDPETFPPLSFASNKGKVYIVVDVNVTVAIIEASTSSYPRTS
jgi:hypothetical protein